MPCMQRLATYATVIKKKKQSPYQAEIQKSTLSLTQLSRC